MEIVLLAAGLAFPEGPVALDDGALLVVEVKAGRLTRIEPDGRLSLVAELGGGPNGAAVGPDGALYVVNNGGAATWRDNTPGRTRDGYLGGYVQRVDLSTGRFETLYDGCGGERLLAPNDIVFDAAGGMWFTTSGVTIPGGRLFGGLYYAAADGSGVRQMRRNLLSPNGVGLSPDDRVLYMSDTQLQRIWAFDLLGPGELAEPPAFQAGRVLANLPGVQPLDSLAVEAGGAVCVATIFNGGITTVHPDGGLEHAAFPDTIVTNICFGSADMRTAWVTCGATGRVFRARWPRPGLRLAFNA